MSARALILTYHSIGPGNGPLDVDAATFSASLDAILESGARVVGVTELADALRRGRLTKQTVAITFDDGLASVTRVAAPLLGERGMSATVFCVAGYIGGTSDWPSALPSTPRHELAAAEELAELARAGWEIGCHGMTHAPLEGDSEAFLRREVLDSKAVLEQIAGVPVRSFAYPYGAMPSPAGRRFVAEAYAAACSTRLGYADVRTDRWALSRVDAHYVRTPSQLRRAIAGGLGAYLGARRIGSITRRAFRKDYAAAGHRR